MVLKTAMALQITGQIKKLEKLGTGSSGPECVAFENNEPCNEYKAVCHHLGNIEPHDRIRIDTFDSHFCQTEFECDLDHSDPSVHTDEVLFRSNPYNIADERKNNWPELQPHASSQLAIYSAVKQTGLPNCLSAKIELTSALKIEAWETLATFAQLDSWNIDMIHECTAFLSNKSAQVSAIPHGVIIHRLKNIKNM